MMRHTEPHTKLRIEPFNEEAMHNIYIYRERERDRAFKSCGVLSKDCTHSSKDCDFLKTAIRDDSVFSGTPARTKSICVCICRRIAQKDSTPFSQVALCVSLCRSTTPKHNLLPNAKHSLLLHQSPDAAFEHGMLNPYINEHKYLSIYFIHSEKFFFIYIYIYIYGFMYYIYLLYLPPET